MHIGRHSNDVTLQRSAKRLLCAPALLLLGLSCLAITKPASADLLADLVEQGVRITSGQSVRLPAPIMADGLSPAEQVAALKKAADKYPLDRFTRDAVVAPFVLEIESVEDDAGRRRGQRVNFWFVAYGPLAAMEDEGLFDDLAGAQEGASSDTPPVTARALTEDELNQRDLTATSTADRESNFILIDATILDRVHLVGVAATEREKQAASVVAALLLDARFRDDAELLNRWQPVLRDAAGRMELGAAAPYSGLGGYIKLTELAEPAGALFVECHVAFDEPEGWFEGKNLLRSKLPLVVQDNVRTFRRKLAKAAP